MSWSLDLTQPVELDHPFNRGRALWLYGVSGAGGRLPNIMPGDRCHATLQNGASWTGSQIGNALSLNSASSQHAIFTGQVGPSSWSSGTTRACFRYNTTPAAFGGLFASSNLFGLIVGGAGNALAYWWDNTGGDYTMASGLTVTPGVPYYGAVSVAPGQATVYLGELLTGRLRSATRVATHSPKTFGPTDIWYFGSERNNAGRYLNGWFGDCVAWANRSLSPAEIQDDFQHAIRNYRTPDSQLRFIQGTAFGLPLSGTPTTITATPITLRVSLVAPVVRVGTTITAPALTQRLAIVAPTVRTGTTLAPSPLSLRVSPVAPSVSVGTRISSAPLSVRLTLVAPTVTAGVAGATNITAPALSMRLAIVLPSVRVGTRITASPLALRLSPVAPSVRVGTRITVSPLALRLALRAPMVSGGGAIPGPLLPPIQITIRGRQPVGITLYPRAPVSINWSAR